jgi:spore germination protein YaaH
MTLRFARVIFLAALVLWHVSMLAQPLKAVAYQGWWMPQSWKNGALKDLDRLFFFELKVDATGKVSERHGWPEQWHELQVAAKAHQVPVDLTLTLFDSATFNQLFSSDQAMNSLLAECIELAAPEFVSGLQFDFEIYNGATAVSIRNYRAFLGKLSAQLRTDSVHKNLSVFLPALADDPLYDEATLGLMNLVVVQSYDTHYRSSSRAGPVAPLNGPDALTWRSAAAEALALGVNKERLFLTFPLYGYEWLVKDNTLRSQTQKPGTTTTFSTVSKELLPDIQVSATQRVHQYGASHDPVSGSAYYQFKNEQNQWVEGWFEDWWSLGRKIDFLNAERLGGAAFFLLGYDHNELLAYYLHRRSPNSLDALINALEPGLQASP